LQFAFWNRKHGLFGQDSNSVKLLVGKLPSYPSLYGLILCGLYQNRGSASQRIIRTSGRLRNPREKGKKT
jgi:hypothetical protein